MSNAYTLEGKPTLIFLQRLECKCNGLERNINDLFLDLIHYRLNLLPKCCLLPTNFLRSQVYSFCAFILLLYCNELGTLFVEDSMGNASAYSHLAILLPITMGIFL